MDAGSAGSLQGPVRVTGGLGTYITGCLGGEGIGKFLPLEEWGWGPTGSPSTTNGHTNIEMGTSCRDMLRPLPAPVPGPMKGG